MITRERRFKIDGVVYSVFGQNWFTSSGQLINPTQTVTLLDSDGDSYTIPLVSYLWSQATWDNIIPVGADASTGGGGAVDSVNGYTGTVVLTSGDLGLGNVNNTSDLNKPISNATQTALDNKVDKVAGKDLSTNDYTNADMALVHSALQTADLNGFVHNPTWNNSTYTLTLPVQGGMTMVIDLPVEQLLSGLSYNNGTKELILTLEDGSTSAVPISDLVVGLASETFVSAAITTFAGTLANVAFSGDYMDLVNQPTIPPTYTAGAGINITGGVISATGGTPGTVTSVNTIGPDGVGNVTLTKADIGLGNVDNTSDINKPISTATQTALDLKTDDADLHAVAKTGDYDDLINKPTIPVMPVLAPVATTGDYTDLVNTPTIPAVPTNVSAFMNDAGYLTTQVKSDWDATTGAAEILNKPNVPIIIKSIHDFTADANIVYAPSDQNLQVVSNTSATPINVGIPTIPGYTNMIFTDNPIVLQPNESTLIDITRMSPTILTTRSWETNVIPPPPPASAYIWNDNVSVQPTQAECEAGMIPANIVPLASGYNHSWVDLSQRSFVIYPDTMGELVSAFNPISGLNELSLFTDKPVVGGTRAPRITFVKDGVTYYVYSWVTPFTYNVSHTFNFT